MLAATALAIFIIPSLFVLVERLARKDKPGPKTEIAPAAPPHAPVPHPTGAGGAK